MVVVMAEEPTGGGGTINIPKIGRVKKVYVYAGVAVVGVLAVIWYRNHKAGTQAATDASTAATDTTDTTGTDYAPGIDYSGDGGGGYYGDTGDVPTQVDNGPPFTSNAAWAQYATDYLTETIGLDPGAVSTDLGSYLAGSQVTPAQADVIRQAVGYAGAPPVTGASGYPPSINVVGDVTGPSLGVPGAPVLSKGNVSTTSIGITWPTVSGATGYAYTATGPSYSKSGSFSAPGLTLDGLVAGTSYTVKVHATNSAGAGPDASITVATAATTAPKPPPTAPPPPVYYTVTVVKYTTSKPPWNSTISGIAAHYGYGSNWQAVWNDPKNLGLRTKRKQPDAIQPGDTVYVKKK